MLGAGIPPFGILSEELGSLGVESEGMPLDGYCCGQVLVLPCSWDVGRSAGWRLGHLEPAPAARSV